MENRPGAVREPCRALADAGINIMALSLADTANYGILRLIVQDPDRAQAVLERAGSVVNVAEVLAIDVPDRPGGLADLLDILDSRKLQIVYMYAISHGSRHKQAAMVFRFEDPDRAIAVLAGHNINAVSSVELFARSQ